MYAAIHYARLVRQPDDLALAPNAPSLLDGAVCLFNEVDIYTTSPISLHGRPDQVFQLTDGRLLIMDTKTRSAVATYPSDAVQSSVYGLILKNQGYQVVPYGVIRFSGYPNARYRLVKLLPEDRVVALYHRYLELKSGGVVASCRCGNH